MSSYSYAQLVSLAEKVGWNPAQAKVMAAIAMAESGGRVGAVNNSNTDGSSDFGLWQINSSHGYDQARLTSDPLYNARMAYKIWHEQGLGAWTTYSSGAYTQFLNDRSPAVQNFMDTGGSSHGVGAPAGNNQFSASDVNAAFGNLGIPKALIDADPTLSAAFHKIVSKRIDDPTRIEAIIRGTKWWKSRDAAQRKFDGLQYDDPAEFRRQLAQKQADIRTEAQQLGINLKPNELQNIAHMALRNGFDDNELQRALAGHFQYQQNQTYTGQAGSDIQGLQKLASEYYVRIDPGRIDSLTQRMLSGQLTPEAMTDWFKQQALSRFSHLKSQLDSGLTVADVASPYVNAMSQILEVSPTSIKTGDNTILKALQQPDGKGGFQLMPEWQFEDTLRNDPRWLKTDNARDSMLGLGHDLLKSWGVAV